MQLTKNFSLAELIHSNTAISRGIDNTPTQEIIERLKYVAENVLQPLRDHFNIPILVNSGYRSQELNKAVGGSPTSYHAFGYACDIEFNTYDKSIFDIFDYIYHNLPFTELILENAPTGWVHVALREGDIRKDNVKLKKVGEGVKRMAYEDILKYWQSVGV